jgi:hypothetical protein
MARLAAAIAEFRSNENGIVVLMRCGAMDGVGSSLLIGQLGATGPK